MKCCVSCKQDKDESSFNKNKTRSDGLNNICKHCSRDRSKKYYRENTAKHKAVVRDRIKKQIRTNQEFILSYLAGSKCADCGETNILVLEFDHQFDKITDVSAMVLTGYSLETISKEIAKCEVVCANCHRIRTHKTFNTYRAKYLGV